MATALPRATIFSTEARDFPSSIMGVTYQISISFPFTYPEPNRKYPVIYLLDGDTNIGLVSGITSGLMWGQVIPECLVVGVGHHVNTLEEWWQARAVDLNLPENPNVVYPEWMQPYKVRRAPDFLRFLKNELIPFIESTYPVDPADRGLFGYSWGGQFTLYALFHEPDLFQKCFIGSAIWDQNLPDYLDYVEQLARQRKSLPARVYISVGAMEEDQFPFFQQLIETLKRRNFDDFWLKTQVIEGVNHGSGMAPAFIQGLRELYSFPHGPV
jgi:uncharacterized protein